ncbi:MAG: cell division protein FtsW [Frankiaceae bacterium]|nr:cell division protein FtsW [Frankiaceae bacterium]MDX6274534.1 cell division protein FtsW [Frankiales bacterium]
MNRFLDRPLASYYLILGATAILVTLGLVMVLSASSVVAYVDTGSSFTLLQRQAMYVAVGLPLMWVASRLHPRVYRALAYPLLLASLAGLVLVLVPGMGVNVNGATRWINLGGPLRLQPSEFAKLGLVLWGADLIARKHKLLGDWKHLLLPLIPVTGVAVLLVMIGRDLGTTLVLLTIVLALLWVSGAPGRVFGAMVGAVVTIIGLLVVIEPYRLQRLTSFTDPFKDAHGSGYQAAQGIYALSSGGWWGLGLGGSREKWEYLPHAHTDFIFAIIGEELGLVGTLAVLTVFAALGLAGARVAMRSTDRFSRLAAATATAWIMAQALINIGAVINVLPVTGIPLPLVSFGGSSLLPTMAAIGMLLSFARREPGAAAALRTRGPGPIRQFLARRRLAAAAAG